MEVHSVVLYIDTDNRIKVVPEQVQVCEGDTIKFIAEKGSYTISFPNCLEVFSINKDNITSSVYQGGSWETPEFASSDSETVVYCDITLTGAPIDTERPNKGPSKTIIFRTPATK